MTLLAAVLALGPCAPAPAAEPAPREVSVPSGGRERRAWVLSPPGRGPRPAVLALPGTLGVASLREVTRHGLERLAARDGWVLAYAETYKGQWNDGRGVPDYPVVRERVDDVRFLAALLERLVREEGADPGKLFLVGYSIGGTMAQRFACERAGSVAAVASVAGALAQATARSCRPASPVPMLLMLGTADPYLRWERGLLMVGPFQRGRIVSPARAMALWARGAGCAGRPERSLLPDRDRGDASTVRLWRHPSCAGGAEVRLYEVRGGGHAWPGGAEWEPPFRIGAINRDLDAAEEVWSFFAGRLVGRP